AALLLPFGALIILAAGAGARLALERRTCVGLGGARFVARRVGLRATASEPPSARRRLATACERLVQSTRLDRSPLLWNILLGQMTLVGPRLTPCGASAAGVETLPGYAARYAVRPGLIGWAQLRAPLGEIAASPRRELEH